MSLSTNPGDLSRWTRRTATLSTVAILAVLLGACAGAPASGSGAPDVTATWYSDDGSVATRSNRSFEVHGLRGPEHCQWQSVHFLSVLWPPGRKAPGEMDASDTRQYVRDAERKLGSGAQLMGDLDLAARLPADAVNSGYHTESVQLWFGPDEGDQYAYLVTEDRTERWPRAREHVACA
jgi:hypothetical protein